ncbi:Peroxidase family protein [Candidatus Sulfotelmatomonas gaucii]|uniref:Peroxidase family protein n=1 Tax=Candidatus Sulfuritelmatomonas gaucii TaxID=2043161 RepID=A0A2N9MA02_9BACT|nr:Peroxidase family protein [Candidatus Sulfotelmatomonas gaucii]
MAHIGIPEGIPGIVGAYTFRPETAKPMRELAEILLRGPSTLTSAEREGIAAFVSSRNGCRFCQLSHSSAAAEHRGGAEADYEWVETLNTDPSTAEISGKMRALLQIAAKVREGGKNVTQDDIAAARAQHATDLEIHDTVLIAAAFCMYNRYVDGLATWQPEDFASYRPMGKRLAHEGYVRNIPEADKANAR